MNERNSPFSETNATPSQQGDSGCPNPQIFIFYFFHGKAPCIETARIWGV